MDLEEFAYSPYATAINEHRILLDYWNLLTVGVKFASVALLLYCRRVIVFSSAPVCFQCSFSEVELRSATVNAPF